MDASVMSFTRDMIARYGNVLGDDPMTSGQNNEVQLLVCEATEGTFTLTFYLQGPPFRPVTTKPIPYTASAADLKETYFEGIAVIHAVYSYGTTVCSPSNQRNVIKIEFKQNFGDLPVMIVGGDQ